MNNKLLKNYMTSPAITCENVTTINEVINIFVNKNIGFIPITKNNFLIGVVTDRDILIRAINKHDLNSPIETIMSAGEIHYVHPNSSIHEAGEIMADHKVRRLVVLDDGKPVGVLTSKNILHEPELFKYIVQTYQKSNTLPQYEIYSNSNPHDSVKTSDYPL